MLGTDLTPVKKQFYVKWLLSTDVLHKVKFIHNVHKISHIQHTLLAQCQIGESVFIVPCSLVLSGMNCMN